ncbi:TPA: FAD-dependent oxidoreductase [Pseudomonas aeruginosa]|nr:FAD-dependent oxidoreductase [Pseudomonas aeruginosa]
MNAEVIVVGAGIVGSACAHELARRGLDVLVLDSRRGGATAVGMGHLVAMDDNPAELALSDYSIQAWRTWAADLPEDCAYRNCGTLWLAADASELAEAERKRQALQAAGVACRMLGAARLYALEPALRPGLAGALEVSGDGILYAPNAARWLLDQAGPRLRRLHAEVSEVDGSRLRLNARSKARLLLDGAQRRLELRRGAMRLEVKEDPRGAFALDCAAGRVDCASGSLLLAEERGAIRLVTLRGSARLTTGEGRQLAVAARRSLLFDAGGLLEQGPMQAGEDAWASGWLEVHDRSLAWVAEAFRPYLPGILQLDAEIAGNRVSGLFPLDDMHTSLDMLGRSLPIRVLRYSDYWISLRPA